MRKKILPIAFILLIQMPLTLRSQDPAPALGRVMQGYGVVQLDQMNWDLLNSVYFAPMRDAGFTGVELKLGPADLRLEEFPERVANFLKLAKTVSDYGLGLEIYMYPTPHDAKRPISGSKAAAWMGEDGTPNERVYSLSQWEAWEELFTNVISLASTTKGTSVTALKLDLETINNAAVSYDDATWGGFAQMNGLDVTALPGSRAAVLKTEERTAAYQDFYWEAVARNLHRLATEILKRNPDLQLGFMPAHPGNRICDLALKNFTRPDGAIIADTWVLYNGSGVTPAMMDEMESIRAVNPKASVRVWFRLNTYLPEALESHAYHAAMLADGYSFWALRMLLPDQRALELALPKGVAAADYWKAFGHANANVRQSLSEGKSQPDAERVPLMKIEPLVAKLDLDLVSIPNLPLRQAPRPSGSYHYTLRDQSVIHFTGKAGEETDITIRHAAGDRRPISLQYAILGPDRKLLRNEAIAPGATEIIHFVASQDGLQTLVVSGGVGSGAWYSVGFRDQFHAIDCHPQTYFFLEQPVEGALWSTGDLSQTSISTGRGQIVRFAPTDHAKVDLREGDLWPLQDLSNPQVFSLSVPDDLDRTAFYSQDVFIKSPTSDPTFIVPSMEFLPFEL